VINDIILFFFIFFGRSQILTSVVFGLNCIKLYGRPQSAKPLKDQQAHLFCFNTYCVWTDGISAFNPLNQHLTILFYFSPLLKNNILIYTMLTADRG